jgi:hypothetical protein
VLIPTIKVKSSGPGGCVIINQSDFDPAIHTPYEEPTEKSSAEGSAPANETKGAGQPKGGKGKLPANTPVEGSAPANETKGGKSE